MPNIKKMTTTKKTGPGVEFRFRPSALAGTITSTQASVLKVWDKNAKKGVKAENERVNKEKHKGVGRKARRKDMKPKHAK